MASEVDNGECDHCEGSARMISEHHIYMTADGRISMAGVTAKNAKYIAESIMEVTGGN